MGTNVRVESTETVPTDASVFHYDELDGALKERFPELARAAPTEEAVPEVGCSTSRRAYVKFTDYYRVTCR